MKKVEARIFFKEKRMALTPFEVNVAQDLLLIEFQKMSFPYFNLVHAYLPIYSNNEPDPTPLLDWMRFTNPGMQVVYPKINSNDFSMTHLLQDENTLFESNKYGIPEPISGKEVNSAELDFVFVPLLGFDMSGNRVGYGKGYYDRFLAKCKDDVIKVGLSFISPIDSIEDMDFFDKKLDFCITPAYTYAF